MGCPRYQDCKGGAVVRRLARIGANAMILPGVTIDEGALVGAGPGKCSACWRNRCSACRGISVRLGAEYAACPSLSLFGCGQSPEDAIARFESDDVLLPKARHLKRRVNRPVSSVKEAA
jgi:NDP-sugar pyrophosphorylase family protein